MCSKQNWLNRSGFVVFSFDRSYKQLVIAINKNISLSTRCKNCHINFLIKMYFSSIFTYLSLQKGFGGGSRLGPPWSAPKKLKFLSGAFREAFRGAFRRTLQIKTQALKPCLQPLRIYHTTILREKEKVKKT